MLPSSVSITRHVHMLACMSSKSPRPRIFAHPLPGEGRDKTSSDGANAFRITGRLVTHVRPVSLATIECMHTHVQACMHTYIHAHMHAYVHTNVPK